MIEATFFVNAMLKTFLIDFHLVLIPDPACQNIDTKKHCYTSQSFCQTDVNQKCHACDNNFLIVIIALLCVIVVISLIISLFVYKKKHSKNESKLMHEISKRTCMYMYE